jgi:predicted MFS family arabinose efflux permease
MQWRRTGQAAAFVLAAALCDGVAIANHLTAVFLLDNEYRVDAAALGLLATVSTMGYVATVVLCGSLADRCGRRRMTCAGALTMALANLSLATTASTPALVGGLLLKGIGAALFWPALAGWLGEGVGPRALPRRLAVYNLGWCGGQVVGMSAAGVFYRSIGARASFALYSGVCLALIVLLVRLPAVVGGAAADTADQPLPSTARERRQAWAANFAGFFVLSELRTLFAPFARAQLGLGPEMVGLLLATMTALQLAMFLLLGLIRPRWATGRGLLPAQAAVVAGLLLLATGSSGGAASGLLATGLLIGISNTASLFHSMCGRDDPSRQSGIHEALLGSASILGPVLGGLCAAWWGPAAPWWLGAVVTLAALAPYARRAQPAPMN